MSDAYVDSMLATGETIQMEARQHWVAMIRFALQPILVLGAAFLFLGIGMWLTPSGDGLFNDLIRLIDTVIGWITVLLFILAVAWLPIQIYRWTKRRYMVTDRRVLYLEGAIRHTSTDAGLNMITDVAFRQGLLGQRLGYGDLVIATASNRPLEFRQMRDAVPFKQAIMAAQQGTVVARADQILQSGGMEPIAAASVGAAAAAPVGAAGAAPATAPAVPAVVAAAAVEEAAPPAWDGSDVPQMAEDDLPPADPLIFGTPGEDDTAEPVAEAVEAAPEPVAEPVAEAVEAAPEPVAEAVEAAPEPVAEPVAEAVEAAPEAATPSGTTSATAALEDLAGLRDSGAITEAEFEARKQQLLDQI